MDFFFKKRFQCFVLTVWLQLIYLYFPIPPRHTLKSCHLQVINTDIHIFFLVRYSLSGCTWKYSWIFLFIQWNDLISLNLRSVALCLETDLYHFMKDADEFLVWYLYFIYFMFIEIMMLIKWLHQVIYLITNN